MNRSRVTAVPVRNANPSAGAGSSGPKGNTRARDESRQAFGPCGDTFGTQEEILAKLELDVRQTAAFAVLDDRVVGEIAHRVWLVVADNQPRLLSEELQEWPRHRGIAVEHAYLPRSFIAEKRRREGMHRDQDRGESFPLTPIELGADAIVVGQEHVPRAGRSFGGGEHAVAGDLRPRAAYDDRVFGFERAIAVDDQPRVRLRYQDRVEPMRQLGRELLGPDVPGDVALEICSGQAQSFQRTRKGPPCVIAREHEGRSSRRQKDLERRRVVVREKRFERAATQLRELDSVGLPASFQPMMPSGSTATSV